ncbi:MAG: BatA domain-containing protein [Sphingobacteriaceae bacterium]
MQLLYPGFLFALVALAIPILIHLFHFRRFKKVYFSNVQFLKNIQQQQASRKKLTHRLILVFRLLALFFLVMAFARPFLPGKNTNIAGKQHVISIFVDNSYSMQTLDREGSLLDEARRKAKEIVAAYNLNDRFQLLTQDFEGSHQRLLSGEEFNEAIEEIKISPHSRKVQDVVSRQQSLLSRYADATPEIYLLSDFQKNMFSAKPVTADRNVSINLVHLQAAAAQNLAVDSVWMLSAIHQPDNAEMLVVRLHNYSDQQAEKVPLKLLINGQQKAIATFSLKPWTFRDDTLRFSGLKAGWQQAEIQINDNPVTFDNRFYFTFPVKQHISVLNIDGGQPNPYLSAVFASDAFFKPVYVSEGNVSYAALNTYPFIMLADVKSVSAGLAQQLKNYVEQGGSLLVFPSGDADLPTYKRFLSALGADYPTALLTTETRVFKINLQSPFFRDVFETMPQQVDLPTVKKYFEWSAMSRTRRENLLELSGKKPFFGVYSASRGKVYLSAVPLNEDFSNLPRHALLVPLIFRIALLSGTDQPLFYSLGKDEVLQTMPVGSAEREPLKLIKTELVIIPDVRQQEGKTLLYVGDQIRETGNYNLMKQDSLLAILAFNDNRSESDLRYETAADLKTKFRNREPKIFKNDQLSVNRAVTDENFGVQLWKLCLILALICLAAEVLLIRYYHPRNQSIKPAQ